MTAARAQPLVAAAGNGALIVGGAGPGGPLSTAEYFDEILLFMDCCRDLRPNVSPVGPVTPPVNSDRADEVRFLYGMAAEVDSKAWEVPLLTTGTTIPSRAINIDLISPTRRRI